MPYYLIYGAPSPIQVYASDPQAAVFYARQALSGQLGRTDLSNLYAGAPMPSPEEGVTEIAGSAKSAGESGADQPQRPGSVTTATQPVTGQVMAQPGGGRPGPGAGPQGTTANSVGPSFANLGARIGEIGIDPDTGLPAFQEPGLLTSFRQALANRGIGENSLFGAYARSQFDPFSELFKIRSGLGLENAGDAGGNFPFQNFAMGNPNLPSLAGQTFSELLRQSQNPENVFTQPYTTGAGQAGSAATSLGLQALAGQGKVLPSFIGASIRPRILEEYQTRSPSENFLSYLRRTLGLA